MLRKPKLTSLRMIHTGESVWMDSLMASSGPKVGSTSPSATPLEKEPGEQSTSAMVTVPWHPALPSLRGSPCSPQLPDVRQAGARQHGCPYRAKHCTQSNQTPAKDQLSRTNQGEFGYTSLPSKREGAEWPNGSPVLLHPSVWVRFGFSFCCLVLKMQLGEASQQAEEGCKGKGYTARQFFLSI